jgi:hypothetical protein
LETLMRPVLVFLRDAAATGFSVFVQLWPICELTEPSGAWILRA